LRDDLCQQRIDDLAGGITEAATTVGATASVPE
jgi:hypothetical protein